MNDLQRAELNSRAKPRPPAQPNRKAVIPFLVAFTASVMLVWFMFLGWGVIAFLKWLMETI